MAQIKGKKVKFFEELVPNDFKIDVDEKKSDPLSDVLNKLQNLNLETKKEDETRTEQYLLNGIDKKEKQSFKDYLLKNKIKKWNEEVKTNWKSTEEFLKNKSYNILNFGKVFIFSILNNESFKNKLQPQQQPLIPQQPFLSQIPLPQQQSLLSEFKECGLSTYLSKQIFDEKFYYRICHSFDAFNDTLLKEYVPKTFKEFIEKSQENEKKITLLKVLLIIIGKHIGNDYASNLLDNLEGKNNNNNLIKRNSQEINEIFKKYIGPKKNEDIKNYLYIFYDLLLNLKFSTKKNNKYFDNRLFETSEIDFLTDKTTSDLLEKETFVDVETKLFKDKLDIKGVKISLKFFENVDEKRPEINYYIFTLFEIFNDFELSVFRDRLRSIIIHFSENYNTNFEIDSKFDQVSRLKPGYLKLIEYTNKKFIERIDKYDIKTKFVAFEQLINDTKFINEISNKIRDIDVNIDSYAVGSKKYIVNRPFFSNIISFSVKETDALCLYFYKLTQGKKSYFVQSSPYFIYLGKFPDIKEKSNEGLDKKIKDFDNSLIKNYHERSDIKVHEIAQNFGFYKVFEINQLNTFHIYLGLWISIILKNSNNEKLFELIANSFFYKREEKLKYHIYKFIDKLQ